MKVSVANAKKYLRRSAVATLRRAGLERQIKEALAQRTASIPEQTSAAAPPAPAPQRKPVQRRAPAPPRHAALSSQVTVVHPWGRTSASDVDSLRKQILGPRTAKFVAVGSPSEDSEGTTEAQEPKKFLVELSDDLGTLEVLGELLREVTTAYVVVAPEEGELVTSALNGLVAALDGTGFALASGNILHTAPTGDKPAPELATSHASDGVADMRENDELLTDLAPSNKVFRTDLLREAVALCIAHGIAEPEGATLAAGLTAGSVLITATPVIKVPFPTESAAIRRHHASTDVLRSSLATVDAGERVIQALDDDSMLERWRAHALGTRLAVYYPLVPRVDSDFWTSLCGGVRRTAKGATESTFAQINLHVRILVHLIIEGRRPDAEAVSYYRSDYGSGSRIDVRDGIARFAPGYLSQLTEDIPEELLACAPEELTLLAGILDYRAAGGTTLEITGYAFIPGIDVSQGEHTTLIELRNLYSGEVVTVRTEQVDLPAIDRVRGDWELSYAGAGFTAMIDTADAPGLADQTDQTPAWEVRVLRTSMGISRSAGFSWRDRSGAAGHLDLLPLTPEGWRLVPTFSTDEGLRLSLDRPRHVIREARLTGRLLELAVHSPSDSLAMSISARCAASGQKANATLVDLDAESGIARYELKLPSVPTSAKVKGEWKWDLTARTRINGTTALAWAGTDAELESSVPQGRALTARLTGFGYLSLAERRWRMLITEVRVTEDGRYLEIEGDSDHQVSQAPHIVLSNARRAIDAVKSELVLSSSDAPDRFFARFDLRDSQWGHEDLALEVGAYSVRYIPPGASLAKSHWLLTSRTLADELPLRLAGYKSAIELSRTEKNGALKVFVKPRLSEQEATKAGQRELQEKYFSGLGVDLAQVAGERAVLVECYGGRRATDTVLEVAQSVAHKYPDVPIYWGVADESVPVPAFARPVVIDSEEWYIRLSSSRLLVNNNNFPHYFRKRSGQYYLQTWHGTPLKRLVFDVDRANFSLSYWALMSREATYWDLLVAQNPYAEEVLAKAFRYEGEVFADGYPRNDSLVASDAGVVRERTRSDLGIKDNQKVALYAPTWRDNAKSNSRQYAMVTYLEFEKIKAALGDDWVILLRGHHNVASGRDTASLGVIDVTDYPQVNDLYLAADVLIGDYSSVMFDFNVQDKPSVFLTPDIDEYADSIRGFYFDFKNEAPGPLVGTTEEVIQVLRHIHIPNRKRDQQRRSFRERFAPLDDGRATDRLVQALPIRELLGAPAVGDDRDASLEGEARTT